MRIAEATLAPPRRGEVRVDLAACGICHSDIHSIDGAWGGVLPAVYGHEAAGVVAAVGEAVTAVHPGDRVVVSLIRACGACFHCARDESYLCEGRFALDAGGRLHDGDGADLVQGLRTGGFAESVVVEQSQVAAVAEDVPPASAALLACGVLTGWGAVVNTAQVPAGSAVGVIGIGGVGINSVQAAALAGAEPVVAVDIAADKLRRAAAFGASCAVDPRREDLEGRVAELTGGRGLDYVFVTVGDAAAVLQGLRLLRRAGTLVLVGMPATRDLVPLQATDLADSGQRILGSKMGGAKLRRDVPRLVALYREGRLKLDELVSGRYRLEEINEAIASVKRGEALRHVVVF